MRKKYSRAPKGFVDKDRSKIEALVADQYKDDPIVKDILDKRAEALELITIIRIKTHAAKEPTPYDEYSKELHQVLIELFMMFEPYMRPGKEHIVLGQVGLWFNISRERIRQIEEVAIRKLKAPKSIRKLNEILETQALFDKERLMQSAKAH
jgi:hypothetical protein